MKKRKTRVEVKVEDKKQKIENRKEENGSKNRLQFNIFS
jgi:hypothetical protein